MILALALLFAQSVQSPSSLAVTAAKDGTKTIEIHNVAYILSDKLLLKKSTQRKQILGDKGMEGTVTLEAWPLGGDLRQPPLYTVKATGTDGQVVDYSLFVIARNLEEIDWWSVYKLSNGQHLFDTFLPLVSFSISRETLTTRYVGFEAAADDTKDPRLKQPKVLGVVTYASEDRVLHEWLLTCDDPKRARLLRSLADVTRKLTGDDRGLTLSFWENYPSPPNAVDLALTVKNDGLDAGKLSPQFHFTPWRR